jgi:peptide/nickel transport system substrate-binding protein
MKRVHLEMTKMRVTAIAAGVALAMSLAACGGGSGDGDGGDNATPEFNAGVDKVYNPSDKKGGTLKMANDADFDSLDPGDTYYGYSWNFIRNYTRSLVTFKSAPGKKSDELVPDLAESLGEASPDAKTWTYKLREGIKYEDGTPVTSTDVKYAVARSLDKDILVNGPTYFNDFLDLKGYAGPYKDKDPSMKKFTAIETPDDRTIIFHLVKPFSGFDYLAGLPATAPVPAAKDTGTKYKEHVMSTGPYMFKSNELEKRFTLTRNKYYDPKTDPDTGRKALPDEITVDLNVNQEDIDQRLQSGDLDVAISGLGVLAETRATILQDPDQKKFADTADQARVWFTSFDNSVKPFDNIHCRKAVMYATDHEGYLRAYGGSSGGKIATNMMPPMVPGYKKIDLYEFESKPNGDLDKAKDELKQCGQPDGFTTNISYRAERATEKATAETLQQSLDKVGIKTELKAYPQDDYGKIYAGNTAFSTKNKLGLRVYGWGADWNDGFGFLSQIVDSRVIRPAGNTNFNVKDPEIDALLDKALSTLDTKEREGIWSEIDQKVMEGAYYLPGVDAKQLLYRPERLTNVFITNAYNMYDYTTLGVQK